MSQSKVPISFYYLSTTEWQKLNKKVFGRVKHLEKCGDLQRWEYWWTALQAGYPTLPKASSWLWRNSTAEMDFLLVKPYHETSWVLAWLTTPAEKELSMASKKPWARVENTNNFILYSCWLLFQCILFRRAAWCSCRERHLLRVSLHFLQAALVVFQISRSSSGVNKLKSGPTALTADIFPDYNICLLCLLDVQGWMFLRR